MAERYSVEAVLKATGAREFSKSFQEAGRSVEGVSKNTGKATMSIGKFVGAIGGVAAAVGVFRTLSNAVDGAVSRYDTLNNFPRVLEQIGFSSEESEGAIERLSEGIQGLPTRLDDVAGSAQRIAVMTGDLEGATEITLALNNALISSGSDANEAARGMDQYMKMISTGKVEMDTWTTLQETMGVALNDVAESFGFAGRTAQNDLYKALQEGSITIDELNEKMIELSTETGGFADRALTASGGIRTAMANVQTAVVNGVTKVIEAIDNFLAQTPLKSIQNIFESLKDIIGDAFTTAAGAIEPMGNALIGLFNVLKPLTPIIIAVVSAILGFALTVAVINTVTSTIAKLRTGMAALNALLLANPVGIVIGVLAGLAALFIYLYKTSDTFREGVNNAFQQVRDFVMPIVQSVVDFVLGVWGAMVAWWNENNERIFATAQSVWQRIVDFITPIVAEVVSFVMGIWGQLTAFWQEHGQMILDAALNVWNVIVTVVSTVISVIVTIIRTLATVVLAIMTFLWPFVRSIIVSTWEAIKGVIQGAIEVITGIIQFFSALFTGNWSAMWDAVKQIVSGAVKFIWNWIQVSFVGRIIKIARSFAVALRGRMASLWDSIRLIFMYAVDAVRKFVLNGFTRIRSGVTSIMTRIRNAINTAWNFIKQIITNVLTGIRNTVSNIWDRIFTTISTIVSRIRDTIRRIFNSLRSIVSNAFTRVTSAVRNGITNAYNVVKNKVKDFFNAGKNIVTNIADGIKNGIGAVTGAIEDVVGKVRDFLPFSPAKEGPLRDIHKVPIVQTIAGAIRKGEGHAVRAMRGVAIAINGEMPEVNLAGQVSRLHRRSSRQMRLDYHNAVEVDRQAAQINLHLGRQQFQAFVEDITNVQDRRVRVREAFNQ